MDIRVSGHQVDTGESLRARVEDRMSGIADKYLSRARSAHVTLGKGPHDFGFTCEIVAFVPPGFVLKGSDRASEAPIAFEGAADKVEKQLRRYTSRLKGRQAPMPGETPAEIAADADYRIFQ